MEVIIVPLTPSAGEIFKTPTGFLELRVVPNPIYTGFFLYIHTLNSFSLADPNCQHQYTCASGSLSSKIRVIWTHALWYWDSWSLNRNGYSVTKGQGAYTAWRRWKKGQWFTPQAGWRGTGGNFITLLRAACNWKRMNCLFLEFSF